MECASDVSMSLPRSSIPCHRSSVVLEVVANFLNLFAFKNGAEFLQHGQGLAWVAGAHDVVARVRCQRKGDSQRHGFARIPTCRHDVNADGGLGKQRRDESRAFGRRAEDLVVMSHVADRLFLDRLVGQPGLNLCFALPV